MTLQVTFDTEQSWTYYRGLNNYPYYVGGVPYCSYNRVLGLLGEGFGFGVSGLGAHSKGPGALGLMDKILHDP